MRIFLFLYTCSFALMVASCLDIRECRENILGKYYCHNDPDASNYLELLDNGTFIQVYKKQKIEVSDTGNWMHSNNSYCQILLSSWKNFNEKGGIDFEEFGNGILFVDGDYLNMGPDGVSSTSFKK